MSFYKRKFFVSGAVLGSHWSGSKHVDFNGTLLVTPSALFRSDPGVDVLNDEVDVPGNVLLLRPEERFVDKS